MSRTITVLDCFAISERGEGRGTNEDVVALEEQAGVFVVADGVGGRPGGKVASEIAVETFLAHLRGKTLSGDGASGILLEALQAADGRVRQAGQAEPLLTGMGTTFSVLAISGDVVRIAHVGDSRIYRFRQGVLRRLTTDHTLVAELVRREHIRPEMAEKHPLRNVLTQALGTHESVEPQILNLDLADGDIFVLATDGLETVMDDDLLCALVREHQMQPSESLCRLLAAHAMAQPPPDDLTVAVVKVSALDSNQEGAV